MATAEEVKKLAALARITIADDELKKFTSEFDAILAYVGQLESLNVPMDKMDKSDLSKLRNVFREDGEPHAANAYTEKLAEQFPARSFSAEAAKNKDGVYLEVKQIITHE